MTSPPDQTLSTAPNLTHPVKLTPTPRHTAPVVRSVYANSDLRATEPLLDWFGAMTNPDPNTIPVPGALPASYHEILYWRLGDRPKQLLALQAISILLFFVFGMLFLNLAVFVGRLPERLAFGLAEVGALVICVALTLVLHELTHALAMRIFGARPAFGVLWKKAMLYCTSPGFAFSRNRYIAITLAPLIVLSAVAIAGMALFSGTLWVAILALCAAMNASGAVGDIWMTIVVRRNPPAAFVMDERDGIRVILPVS